MGFDNEDHASLICLKHLRNVLKLLMKGMVNGSDVT